MSGFPREYTKNIKINIYHLIYTHPILSYSTYTYMYAYETKLNIQSLF